MKKLQKFNNFLNEKRENRNVLFFPSNSSETKDSLKYYNLWKLLIDEFNGRFDLTVDEIDEFINNISDETWYINELDYKYKIHNDKSEYIFCINKS